MTRKTRSARGQEVDFDLLRIKQQMAANPAGSNVRVRQDFIERKINRRTKKQYPKATGNPPAVQVEPAFPGTETPAPAVKVEPVAAEPAKTKQKARPQPDKK